MRAVIYARYSSDRQSEASIEDQVRLCRRRIDDEGWILANTYTDHAVSGAGMLRPGYQKLIEDACRRGFEVVVAEALDRLSRDQEDVAALFKQLRFANVQLLTLAEGEISELHVGLKGTMNALYLKDLAQKTWRGLEGRVRKGRSGGGICYGYDVVRESDAAGNAVRGGRRINAAQAAVIHRIFKAFAAGRSPRAIARELNGDGIPGPGGRIWRDTSIRGHHTRGTGILHNELYIGRLVWNRQRYVKDPRTGKRLARVNPEAAWIVEEVPELRIVDQALWDRVQARLGTIRQSPGVTKARSKKFWEQRRARHLLTGLVRCGGCGEPMASVGRDYLACGRARAAGSCENRKSIRREALENLILDALKANLMDPDLVREFIRAFHEEVNRQRQQDQARMEAHRRRLTQITRKLDGLIDAIADGLRTPGLKDKLQELERQKAELEAQLSSAPIAAPHLHPNLAEVYRQRVADLRQALREPSTRDEALLILRGLIEAVHVQPADAGFEIELIGEIANMVALGTETKKVVPAGSDVLGPYRRSVKVVAGAGFEPATFRL